MQNALGANLKSCELQMNGKESIDFKWILCKSLLIVLGIQVVTVSGFLMKELYYIIADVTKSELCMTRPITSPSKG